MEILYYAVISYCLSSCSTTEDFTRYVHMPAVSLEQCTQTTREMIEGERKRHEKLVRKPFNSLCVQTEVMSKERLSLHIIWETQPTR